MLIKVVTFNGDTHIIEGVEDVSVKANMESYNPYRPTDIGVTELFFENVPPLAIGDQSETWAVKEISYAKNGPCVLLVANIAYICNNDGKTIEKVVAV